ncbi:MAG: YidB family protein [Azonexus sp.]
MGLLDQVVGNLAASALGGKSGGGGIVELVLPLLNKYPGGIGGLVQAFQQGGLGEIVNSWVSTGKNLPVSGDQLTSVLGNDFIGGLAKQLGVGAQEASGSLAGVLPGLIDQLTPNGQIPQGGDLLAQGLNMLKKGGLFG